MACNGHGSSRDNLAEIRRKIASQRGAQFDTASSFGRRFTVHRNVSKDRRNLVTATDGAQSRVDDGGFLESMNASWRSV